MTNKNVCVELASYPEGVPEESNFQMGQRDVPAPGKGEFLARNLYLSLDPFLRGVISGRQMYSQKVQPGDVMPGHTVAEILESNHSDHKVGDLITLDNGGWQQYIVSDGTGALPIGAQHRPLSLNVGILGMPGLTAYAGLLDTAEPKKGDTVVVSAAAGPVGSTVGQLARIHGCRTVGIAGSDEKCKIVVEKFGFDACINYKTEDLGEALAKHCPDGINVYFDNVGGTTLEAVSLKLAIGARVTMCGLITQYNDSGKAVGPNMGPFIGARAIMKGFVVFDHYDKWTTFKDRTSEWIKQGEIRFVEDRSEGLDSAAAQFCRLMRGENVGKSLVVIDDSVG